MFAQMKAFLMAFLPRTAPLSARERLRSAVGALVGILITGLVCRAAVGDAAVLPVLIAPMGASAVLLFAVPSSPLAQPWSIVGGNLVSAVVGVSAGLLVHDPFVAAALSIGAAVALMMSLRCVHPPSGAVALTAVLGGHAVADLGYSFVLWPVGANSLVLLATALAFNNFVGRSYPNRPVGMPADRDGDAIDETTRRRGFASDDLDAVLKDWDRLLDVDRDDLEAILRQAEMRSYRRRSGRTTCAMIMSRDVVAVSPDASIREAFDLLRAHRFKVLPVTDERARVLGMVTQTDLLGKAAWDVRGPRLAALQRMRLSMRRGRAPRGSVEDIMSSPVVTVTAESTLADIVWAMSHTDHHHLPVIDADGNLAGIVSQSDVVVALLAEAAAAEEPVGPNAD